MMAVDFGSGLVVCVEDAFRLWADEHVPRDPHRGIYASIPLTAEAKSRGIELHPSPPLISWALSTLDAGEATPAGYTLRRVDKAWMDAWQPRNVFTNALGLAVQAHRYYRNQFAYVAFDGSDEPVAAAGVFDTAGLSEIGVDVATHDRGHGLSIACVKAAVADLHAEGRTPFYACEVRNVKSQHTALSSGFLPVCACSVVMEAGLGLSA